MTITLMALRLSAAARTAGPARCAGSGQSHGQLQAQLNRLHLQGLMGGGLGTTAEGRPLGRREESQEEMEDRTNSMVTERFTSNGRPERGRAASRVKQRTVFAPGGRRQRRRRQIGLKQTKKYITAKILVFQSSFPASGSSYLQVVSLKR